MRSVYPGTMGGRVYAQSGTCTPWWVGSREAYWAIHHGG